jgi:hypothetical protein
LADRGWRETDLVTSPRATSVFAGFRFPREVISVAVRWYLRYGLSYRDVEELLAERGITVDRVSVYRWLRPMRGLKRHRSARILAAGHAFVQNLRRGHYDIATDTPRRHRVRIAFDELALTI